MRRGVESKVAFRHLTLEDFFAVAILYLKRSMSLLEYLELCEQLNIRCDPAFLKALGLVKGSKKLEITDAGIRLIEDFHIMYRDLVGSV